MLKWLFRKKIAKAEALEGYLSNFDAGELGYLKNITLMGLAPSAYMVGRSPYDIIDLATCIHGATLALTGAIESNVMALSVARAKYRVQLAKDTTSLKPLSVIEFMQRISPHRLPEPNLTNEQQHRLGLHATMLQRISMQGKSAPLLPELDALDEGRAWETSWRA